MSRAWWVVLVAALAACTSSTAGSGSAPTHSAAPLSKPYLVITCATVDGSPAAPDRGVLQSRARKLSASAVVQISGAAARISLPLRLASSASELCAAGQLEFRGVIAAPVPVHCNTAGAPQCSAASVADAARAAGVSVPGTDTDYDRLPAAVQAKLSAALGSFDCRSATRAAPKSAAGAVCGSGSDLGVAPGTVALLVGPPPVTGAQIASAQALAPDAKQGRVAWAVQVALTASGQQAWSRYTTAHNTNNSQTSGSVASCSATTTPCSDYVAVVLDGDVISVPVTLSPITGRATQISGNFTPTSARALATSLNTGALVTPLRAESVVTVH